MGERRQGRTHGRHRGRRSRTSRTGTPPAPGRWTRWLRGYLIVAGVTAHLVVIVGVFVLLSRYQLTPRQALLLGLERVGLGDSVVAELARPAPRFSDSRLDGSLRPTHPRILFPALAGRSEAERAAWFRRREAQRDADERMPGPCGPERPLALAACWFVEGDRAIGERALAALLGMNPRRPSVNRDAYGDAWRMALAYDLLHGFAGMTPQIRARIEARLREALDALLLLLDGDGLSLWHARASQAAEAWIVAVALGEAAAGDADRLRRAQGHFLEAVRALEITGAWPEGYNYWINNRAFGMALAAAAYANGLVGARHRDRVLSALERAAYWNLYGTRPDDRMEALGDEGPRVDLKDETRRFVDLVAQLTGNRLLASYSRYLARLHGAESYFRGYRWGFRLFNDPAVRPLPGMEDGGLEALRRYLPQAAVFGERWMNLAFIRSGWDADATFVSFRAGKSFTHHGHYDAGHFTLFKGAPLALVSGTYGDFFSEHRLHYGIRTVAKNSLLVLRPGERVRPNRFFERNVAAGGQRITLPTGSAIVSTADWASKLRSGPWLDGGTLRAFELAEGRFAYLDSDLTAAYNTPEHDEGGRGGKVERVERRLLYLFGEDRLILHDRVVSVDPHHVKKWLLHTAERPQAEGLSVRRGALDAGILETREREVRVRNGRGRLRVEVLSPQRPVVRLVGGRGYRFYVETDGDDGDLDGENMIGGARERPWFDGGGWRIEVQPAEARREAVFLTVLTPDLDRFRDDDVEPLRIAGAVRGVRTARSLAVFEAGSIEPPFALPAERERLVVFSGLRPGQAVVLEADGRRRRLRANGRGVLHWMQKAVDGGEVRVHVEGVGIE